MDINVTFDASAAEAPTGFEAVVEDVAKFYDSEFSNPITINIHVGWGEVDGQALAAEALGENISNYTNSNYTYAQIKAALDASALTSQAMAAVASLPASDPTGGGPFSMTTAEAKALGLTGANNAVDGWAGFTSTPGTFDFSITTNTGLNDVNATEYDFFGVVAHEFSEIMGRQLNFGINYGGSTGNGYFPLDLYDYSAAGKRALSATGDRYFSINGGVKSLGAYNTDPSGDLFDWSSSVANDSYDAFSNYGVRNVVSANDLTLMNVLGFQPTPDFTASNMTLSGVTLTFTIGDASEGAAPASTTGIYVSTGYPVTPADTLVTNYATPAIAAGGSVTAHVALPLANLAPGIYYLDEIADANGAIAEPDTASNTPSNPIGISILSDSNLAAAELQSNVYNFALQPLAVAATAIFDSLYVASSVSGSGVLEIGGGTLAPSARLTVAEVTVTSGDTNSVLEVATNLNYAGVWNAPFNGATVSIDAGDTLDLTGSANVLNGPVSGAGTLKLSAGEATISDIPGGSDSVLTVATLEVTGAGTDFTFDDNVTYGGDWDQVGGTASVASGDTLTLTGAGDSLDGTLAGAGSIALRGAGATLTNMTFAAAKTTIDAASATLSENIVITGALVLVSPDIVLNGSETTILSGGGALELSSAVSDTIVGSTSSALLRNGVRIVGAGDIGGGEMRLVNEAGGAIEATGSQALVIDTGSNEVVNDGLIEAIGVGNLTTPSAIDNAGTLATVGGVLDVEGAVSGTGSVLIDGGLAEFASTMSENVTFAAKGGEFELADAVAYKATLTGFSTTGAASLDLEDIAFGGATKATYSGTTSGGVLTVTDGTHTAVIAMKGDYLSSAFTVASDGHGGTVITDPTALASAMAAFAPSSSAPGSTHDAVAPSLRAAMMLVPPPGS